MLKEGKEVQVRLNSINGEFLFLVQRGAIPSINRTYSSSLPRDVWVGGSLTKTVLKLDHLSEQIIGQIRRGEMDGDLLDFYVRVYPVAQYSVNSTQNQTFLFDIAFYDEEQIVMLPDGFPVRGFVTN
jgi:hypothetical protein